MRLNGKQCVSIQICFPAKYARFIRYVNVVYYYFIFFLIFKKNYYFTVESIKFYQVHLFWIQKRGGIYTPRASLTSRSAIGLVLYFLFFFFTTDYVCVCRAIFLSISEIIPYPFNHFIEDVTKNVQE